VEIDGEKRSEPSSAFEMLGVAANVKERRHREHLRPGAGQGWDGIRRLPFTKVN